MLLKYSFNNDKFITQATKSTLKTIEKNFPNLSTEKKIQMTVNILAKTLAEESSSLITGITKCNNPAQFIGEQIADTYISSISKSTLKIKNSASTAQILYKIAEEPENLIKNPFSIFSIFKPILKTVHEIEFKIMIEKKVTKEIKKLLTNLNC